MSSMAHPYASELAQNHIPPWIDPARGNREGHYKETAMKSFSPQCQRPHTGKARKRHFAQARPQLEELESRLNPHHLPSPVLSAIANGLNLLQPILVNR